MLRHIIQSFCLYCFIILIPLTASSSMFDDDEETEFRKGITVHNPLAQRAFIEATKGNLEQIKYLVEEKGFDVNYAGEFRRTTVLHWASGSYNIELVRYLVSKGARIGAKDYELKTALHYAAQSGTLETVIFLIRRGANPKYKDQEGRTALYYAHRRSHYKMLEYLEKKTDTKFSDKKK